MNFKKVEKAAKKINQLLENMRDEEQVSKIEKDLLLSYVRDLYEKVIHTDESLKKATAVVYNQNKVAKNHISEPEIAAAPTPHPPVEIADVVRQEIKQTAYQRDPTTSKKTVETPAHSPNDIVYTPVKAVVAEEIAAPSYNNVTQELLELFETGSVNELSDKLSRSPISDLTKSMGINERIFTVNELFGGDTGLFNTTMQELDKLSSLEQARDYLVNKIAVEQNWGGEPKMKKAINFVKLISRRY
ncbi:MAG: hypothetical protein ACI86M_000046 [Saprospiraceae bacterium]|jgi:hypothetical protein